ncbi:MAG: hypothetical protein J5I50_11935, partial [Chitinophagaceae bacterium]|nr:hypothetical protein [Chitinophagaceae bacterium]
MPGIGEVGTNASSVIQNGPGAYIRGGWNGNAFGVQFIIISLQPPGTWPTGKEIHDKMVKIRQQYRIGEVYMTGLSMGGHSTHAYTTEYPDEVKSIVTVEGVGLNATEAEQMPKWSLWLDQGNRVICFEQKNDLRGGTWVTGFLNKYKANSAVYILTNFGGGGHCCWSEFYGGPGKQPGIFNIDGINQTIYEWFAREYLKKNDEENIPPIANAGINQTITLPANKVTLSGSGTDSDGTVVGYEWTKISGPNSYTIVSPTSATTEVKDLTEGSYTFQLKVTDNKGATGTATVKVTVNPAPNKAPTANAGQNQTITLPINTVTLNGSGTDEDGTITAYEWTKTAGPNGYTIVSPNSATTEVKNLTEGTYTFQLKVTDDKGATGTATVKVIVNAAPNKAPTANAGQNQTITLPTNTVTLNGSGTDEDGTITAYEWTKTAGPTSYTIVSPNSATTEVRNLTEGTYTFQLKVTDNRGATGTATVKVTVNPAPNKPPKAYAGADKTITLPTSTVSLAGSG